MTPQEFFKTIEQSVGDIQLIDVRTPAENGQARLVNAHLMDYYQASFKEEVAKLDPNKKTLVYCHSGRRSADACQYMDSIGFKETINLDGGIVAWAQSGLPIEQG